MRYVAQFEADVITLSKGVYPDLTLNLDNAVLVLNWMSVHLAQNNQSEFWDDTMGLSHRGYTIEINHSSGNGVVRRQIGMNWPFVVGSNSLPAVGQYIGYQIPDIVHEDLFGHEVIAKDVQIILTRDAVTGTQAFEFVLDYELKSVSDADYLKLYFHRDQDAEVIV